MKSNRKTRTINVLALASIGLINPLLAAPGDILPGSTEFNMDGNFENWVDFDNKLKDFGWDGTTITDEEMVVGGKFRAKLTQGANNDAQLVNNPISVDARLAGTLEIRIRQSLTDGATWKTPTQLSGFLLLLNGGLNPSSTLTRTLNETVAGDGWVKLTYNLSALTASTYNTIRFDPSDTIGESFEIDYIRFIEIANPRPLVEVDPVAAIPSTLNLVRQWDSAAELDELKELNFSPWATGSCSTVAGNSDGDCVGGTSSGNGDAMVSTPGGLGIPVGATGKAIVEIGVIPSAATGVGNDNQILFWSDSAGGFGGGRALEIPKFTPAQINEGVLRKIRVTFDSDIITELKELRYDPFGGTGFATEIDYIRIYTDTPLPSSLAWDTNSATLGVQGGTGNWDTTSTFWNSGLANNISWPATPTGNDNATFGATAGTVTIAPGGITAHALSFNTTGYTLSGGELTFDSSVSASSIGVAPNVTATIASGIVANNDDLRKTGLGTLVLGGAANCNSFTASGGIVTVSQGATLTTINPNPTENNFGLKLVGGAALNISGTVSVAAGSFGTFSGDSDITLNLNSGGSLTVPTDARFGWNSDATFNLNGGTSSVGGDFIHSDSGTGTLVVGGGMHTISGRLGADVNSSGNASITINNGSVSAASVGFQAGTDMGSPLGTVLINLNLSGGSLKTDQISLTRGPATSPGDVTLNLKLDGGRIIASEGGTSPTLITGILGNSNIPPAPVAFNATVEAGGVTIDTNGKNKAIEQPLLTGVTSAGGGLTKTGSGALYLNGDNTYTGTTLVTAGNIGGQGSVAGNLTVMSGAGLAYRITDPATAPDSFFVSGTATLPNALTVRIDSAGVVFPETAGNNLILLSSAVSITGFNPASVSFDLTNFTGFGTWSAQQVGNDIVLAYTPGVGGYNAWSTTNAGGQSPVLDFDNDGVSNGIEYFMGQTGSSFTPNPAVVNGKITWPKDPAFVGSFKIQVSDTLAANGWTDIVPPNASIDQTIPNQVVFTVPSGDPKKFVRLAVQVPTP